MKQSKALSAKALALQMCAKIREEGMRYARKLGFSGTAEEVEAAVLVERKWWIEARDIDGGRKYWECPLGTPEENRLACLEAIGDIVLDGLSGESKSSYDLGSIEWGEYIDEYGLAPLQRLADKVAPPPDRAVLHEWLNRRRQKEAQETRERIEELEGDLAKARETLQTLSPSTQRKAA